jgi:adenylate cyclase
MDETRKIAAILAADVVGYSRLAGADEDRILARLRSLRSDLIDPTISVHHGRIVKRTGDGALVEFRSVVDAVRCAIEVQSGMVERNAGLPPERRIEFRIGIHLGDVVEESDGDLMGDAVNIAARLERIASPGGICLSEDAYRQVRARLELSVRDLGETQLKNIVEPVHVYSIERGAQAMPAPRTGPAALEKPSIRPPARQKPSIAVLPFQNMSSEPEQEHFSDGISEDIITDLSKIPDLHVIARNSSFFYKDKSVAIPAAARDLGVRYVLEGSVRKAGNRVRVTAQLIDSTTGGHVWANRFDRDLTDIFAVQDDLTQEIVAALKLNLTPCERDRLTLGRAASVEAYELFLRGRELTWAHTKACNIAALNALERAVAIDPDYAAAHARMAFIHVIDYVNGWGEAPEQSLATALRIANKVIETAPDEPDGHYALSVASTWSRDLDRALAESARCLELSPSSAEGHLAAAQALTFYGDPSAALKTLEAYMLLDPLFPEIAFYFVAEARFARGEFALAAAALEKRLARNPQSETSFALLASCFGHMGRLEEGRQAWEQALRTNPQFSVERRRRILPFRNPADFERRVEGLRMAGISV